jgi:hypothetical protein
LPAKITFLLNPMWFNSYEKGLVAVLRLLEGVATGEWGYAGRIAD